MKKNIMMRLSALLLVAVLLTTCVISGTFAKYTDTKSTGDTARVAKWGVVITAAADDDNEYQATALTAEETAVTAVASTKVLAPGSGVKFGGFTVAGPPEVAVEVVYTATLTLANWKIGEDDYVPVVFVINGDEVTGDTMAELKTNVETKINSTKQYAADTDLADGNANDLTVSCYWPFTTTGNDANDTALGNANNATITLSITCTVNQLDEYTPAP